jgi:hypothetical protein
MYRKIRGLAVLAAAVPLLALGLAGTASASAAGNHPGTTPACGSLCQDFSSGALGPATILNAFIAGNTGVAGHGGQDVNMKFASNSQVNADFQVEAVGYVGQYCISALNPDGLLSSASVACLHYYSSPAYELDFSPYGNSSGYCAGTTGTPFSGLNVKLVLCGASEGSLWIQQSAAFANSAAGYNAYISGATTTFSHPFVASVDPGTSHPANQLKLATENLLNGNTVPSAEQFTYVDGPV